MARMHARRKGRSGSSPQTRKENPKWSPKGKDVEKLVMELSSEGKSSSEIGIILRDMHGVPSVKLATGKSVTSILSDGGVASSLPEDLTRINYRLNNPSASFNYLRYLENYMGAESFKQSIND